MTQQDDLTLWEGSSQTLAGAASGGRAATRYRLTRTHLLIERGLMRSDCQQVPLLGVHDVDVKQSMTQRARGVGDVAVHVNHGAVAETVLIEAVKDPKAVRDLINDATAQARQRQAEQSRSQVHIGHSPQPASGAGPDLADQLTKLAALRDSGVLTPEEFATQKARLLG